jgi:hypothetical protein
MRCTFRYVWLIANLSLQCKCCHSVGIFNRRRQALKPSPLVAVQVRVGRMQIGGSRASRAGGLSGGRVWPIWCRLCAFSFTGVHHITLRVTDLARSRRFSQADIGSGLPAEPGYAGKLRLPDGTRIVVVPPLPGIPEADHGCTGSWWFLRSAR